MKTKHKPVHGEEVLCPNGNCKHTIGRLHALEPGIYMLQAGDLLIKDGQSMFCVHCGQVIHWNTNDQRLEQMLKQATGETDVPG